MSDVELAQNAVVKWLLARAAHAKALGDVSRLGREMGIAFTEMLHLMARVDGDVALSVDALKLSAKEPR